MKEMVLLYKITKKNSMRSDNLYKYEQKNF